MKREKLEEILNEACSELYNKDKRLINDKTHEQSICAQIVSYLKPKLKGWNIDAEYNREGNGKPKRDTKGNRIKPDIIIHERGPTGENLAAIQVKGYWNRKNRNKDVNILKELKTRHKYSFLYRLELRENTWKYILVD